MDAYSLTPEWCAGAPSSRHEKATAEKLTILDNGEKFSTEAHTDTEDTIKMHPLIAAAHHNRTKSPLCRLPDDILVQLMQSLDPVTLECLRRCSRIFLRLFPTACAFVRDFSMNNLDRLPWPISAQKFSPAEKEKFVSLVARDLYCQECLGARQSLDWQERLKAMTKVYFHCSGCRVDHPACLFSAKQRQSPQSTRICIGHEGHLRLCEHVTVPWSLVVSTSVKQSKKNPDILHITQCKRSKHVSACANRRLLSRSKIDPICCSRHPTVSSMYGYKEGKRHFLIILEWSAHLSLLLRQDRRFGPEELTLGMAKLREQAARFICPQNEPGQIVGARLFDPGSCDCLEYDGRERTAWDRPPLDWRKVPTCRAEPTFCQGHDQSGGDEHHRHRTNLRVLEEQCFVDCVRSPASRNEAPHGFRAEVSVCSSGRDCIKVCHRSWFSLDVNENGIVRHMNSNWYKALDPESYNLVQDRDGYAIYWCKTESCRNYYLYNRSRLTPLLKPSDYRHACPH